MNLTDKRITELEKSVARLEQLHTGVQTLVGHNAKPPSSVKTDGAYKYDPEYKDAIASSIERVYAHKYKPSECISRGLIYEAVDEGLEKYRITFSKELRGVRECITDTVHDAIRKALGK